MIESSETLAISYKKSYLAKSVVLCLIVGVMTAWFAWHGWHETNRSLRDLGAALFGTVFTLYCAVVIFSVTSTLLSGRAPLEVTEAGVRYRHLLSRTKWVFWDEVGSFVVREQFVYRNKTQNIVDVLPRDGVKPLLSIYPDDLDVSIADLVSLLESSASAHAERSREYAVRDTRFANSSTNRTLGIISVVLVIVVSTLGRIGCSALDYYVTRNNEDVRMQRYFDSNPLFQAIEKVDPEAGRRYRQVLHDVIVNGGTQKDLEVKSASFMRDFAETHFKRATPTTLRKFLTFRLDMYEKINNESPEALYAMVVSGRMDMDALPEKARASVLSGQQAFFNQFAALILAPPSEHPIKQDTALVSEKLAEIRGQLTDTEAAALVAGKKPGVDKAAYCRALIKVYGAGLALPDSEMVQVFRALHELPDDDRNSSEGGEPVK